MDSYDSDSGVECFGGESEYYKAHSRNLKLQKALKEATEDIREMDEWVRRTKRSRDRALRDIVFEVNEQRQTSTNHTES